VIGQIERAGAQRITASPALVERLVGGAGDGDGAMKAALHAVRIVTGGGPVFPDLVARATALTGAPMMAVYGSTEVEPIAHVSSVEIGDDERRAMRGGAGLIAGRPVRQATVRIVPVTTDPVRRDELLRGVVRLAAGTRGEIVVSGRHVVAGYLHGRGDAETKIHLDGVVWHRTGDAGYVDDRGRLWLLGRVSATISDGRGELHPFAVECAARLVLPGRRTVLAGHRGARILLVEGPLAPRDRAAIEDGLRWASLDRVIDDVAIPLDRRHNSKVDYGALPALLERLAPTPLVKR
jgi:acyl-CoA synthetase (AMP-forming)/AMP-acid ligase II